MIKNLMIVDMQKGQTSGNDYLANGINRFLKSRKFENVFYTQYFNHEKSIFFKALNYRRMTAPEDTDFCVNLLPTSIVFKKESYGLNNEQITELKNKGIKEILLCGTDIDACIFAIAFNLFDNGIRPYFQWNLCGTKNKKWADIKKMMKIILTRTFGLDCIVE